jgi:TPR repeat protein
MKAVLLLLCVAAVATAFPVRAQSYYNPRRVTDKAKQAQQQQQKQIQQAVQPTPPTPQAPTQQVVPVPPQPRPLPVAVPAKPVDPEKAAAEKEAAAKRLLAYQKEQAEKGSAVSQFDLGMRYLKGDGVEQDEKLGREWIEKSAKQGNEDAAKKLKELDDTAKAEAGKGGTK